jgi:hypothetical protein
VSHRLKSRQSVRCCWAHGARDFNKAVLWNAATDIWAADLNERVSKPLPFIAGMDDPGASDREIRELPPVGRGAPHAPRLLPCDRRPQHHRQ